jgi:hypothetical protein
MWTKEMLEECGCWFDDAGECITDDINLNKFAKLIIQKERKNFCTQLAQLHDSYSLASNTKSWSEIISDTIR